MFSPKRTNDYPSAMVMNNSTLAKVPLSSIHPCSFQSKKIIRNKNFVVTSASKNSCHRRDCCQEINPNEILKEVLEQFGRTTKRTARDELGPQSNQKRIKRRNAMDLTGPTKNECFILRHRFLLLQSRQNIENQDETLPRSTSWKSSFIAGTIGGIQQKISQFQWINASMTSNSSTSLKAINKKIWRSLGLTELNEEEDGTLEDIPQERKRLFT